MSLRLRHISLRVDTEAGPFGASLPFVDGLVILRADNTSGKSTVVQSFVYALGLEGMLSAGHDVPLPHVMTDSVQHGERHLKVLASQVAVEIENQAGERVVVQRVVKGATDRHLVRVTFGPALTNPAAAQSLRSRDLYVRWPNAAQSESGFHHWLADWIGWRLPIVGKFDGGECPLYMECMFPFMLVEQKRGWAGIPARLPIHYRIRDVGKRAIEFLLALDVYDTTVQRQRLREQQAEIRVEWKNLATRVDALIAPANGVVQNLPKEPINTWPPVPNPAPRISRGGIWNTLSDAQRQDHDRLAQLDNAEIPRVKQVSAEAAASLLTAEADLAETEFVIARLFNDVQLDRNQLESLQHRIATLAEDIRRNKDVRLLRKMGSTDNLDMKEATCPTCHQSIVDTLLPSELQHQPMTIDDNIAYLESQMDTFEAARATSANALTAKERRLNALRSHADGVRSKIRALKETLVSDGQEPSIAAIEERIKLRDSVRLLKRIDEQLVEGMVEFDYLAAAWKSVQDKIDALPKGDLSALDERKVGDLQWIFIDAARQFGVTSLPPESLAISRESYKPTHDGFELEFDLSASDTIRVIWAYLHALLELARRYTINHLGLLIMDEPGQQQMKRVSLQQLIKRASTAAQFGQQVILATSEEESNLREQLENLPHSYVAKTGFIIQPLNPPRS